MHRATSPSAEAPGLLAFLRRWLEWLNGDVAYERYVEHVRASHPDETPLSRAAFYRREIERRWNGVRRCC